MDKQLEESVRNFILGRNDPANRGMDYLRGWTASEKSGVFIDPINESIGSAETEQAMAGWDKAVPHYEITSPVDVYPNCYGPGVHLVEVTVKVSTENPMFEGATTGRAYRYVMIWNNDSKLIRIQLAPADDATRNWVIQMMAHVDKARGVPEGGYKDAKDSYIKHIQLFAKGLDAVMDNVTDDVVYVDPLGEVTFGKDALKAKMAGWYKLGLTDCLEPNEIWTPLPNKASAMVNYVMGKLPDDCPLSKHLPASHIVLTFDEKTKKVARAVAVSGGPEARKWARDLVAWMGKKQAAAGAA